MLPRSQGWRDGRYWSSCLYAIHNQSLTRNPEAPRGWARHKPPWGPVQRVPAHPAPSSDPDCTLRNAEATQCKFFRFVATTPLPWSRRREQTQLAPCFLSTFHPTAFSPGHCPTGSARSHPAPHDRAPEREQGFCWPAPRCWLSSWQGTPKPGGRWRGDEGLDGDGTRKG